MRYTGMLFLCVTLAATAQDGEQERAFRKAISEAKSLIAKASQPSTTPARRAELLAKAEQNYDQAIRGMPNPLPIPINANVTLQQAKVVLEHLRVRLDQAEFIGVGRTQGAATRLLGLEGNEADHRLVQSKARKATRLFDALLRDIVGLQEAVRLKPRLPGRWAVSAIDPL